MLFFQNKPLDKGVDVLDPSWVVEGGSWYGGLLLDVGFFLLGGRLVAAVGMDTASQRADLFPFLVMLPRS